MNVAQTLSRRVLYGGSSGQTREARDQIYVINMFSLLAILSVLVFGMLHIFAEGNRLFGQLEIAGGAVIAVNTLVLWLTHNTRVARVILLVIIMALLLGLLITGGTSGTGIFWAFVFPVITFFLMGKRNGLLWTFAFYASIAILVALKQTGLMNIPYSMIAIRQMLVSLVVVTVGMYVYEGSREKAMHDTLDSQRDLQEYLDHMMTFSTKIGIDGRVLFANKIAKEVSGLGEHIIGTKFAEGQWWTFDQAVQRRVEAAFYQALGGKTVNYDEQMRVATATGAITLTVNFSMIPIFENKSIKYILAEARDISAEQEVDRAKSEFVAVASHQLRAPISSVSTSAGTLLNDQTTRLNDHQRQLITQIYTENQRMGALIDDMLMVASLELGTLPVRPVASDVVALARGVVNDIETTRLQNRRLTIGEDYADNLPSIAVDPSVVRIILRNLLTNAINYTPDAGHVNVRIKLSDGKVRSDSKGSLQLEIQDSGYGIPPSAQKKLFAKFFHAGTPHDRAAEGSGLGLYLVKSLLDYSGGTVSFTSKENVGTIFVVLLPLEGMRAQPTS